MIVRDVEYEGGARATLERDSKYSPWAFTCGVYGLGVHSAYFESEPTAQKAFAELLPMLAEAHDALPDADVPAAELDWSAASALLRRIAERF